MLDSVHQIILDSPIRLAETTPMAQDQRAYLIDDANEAKLLYDVLVGYGFDLKLYREEQYSKLCVAMPRKKLDFPAGWVAEAHTSLNMLIALKNQIVAQINHGGYLSANYSISPSQPTHGSRTITIRLPEVSTSSQPQNYQNLSSNRDHLVSKGVNEENTKVVHGSLSRNNKDKIDIYSGPDVLNPTGIRRSNLIKVDESPDSLWKQTKLYIKGNAFYSGLILAACFLGLVVFISFVVLGKAFLCPDFASMKDESPPWYCTYN
jgi:hypothetical protein